MEKEIYTTMFEEVGKEQKESAGLFNKIKNAMTKKYDDEKKLLIAFHRIWRIVNWLIITWLANQAFSKALDMLKLSRTGRPKFIFLVASITISAIMVVFAEGTSHDHFRRKTGQVIAVISEFIMLLPVLFDTGKILFCDWVNALTENIGGWVWNVENHKNSDLGRLWILNLILAGVVCVSLLREEQSTDKYLGFARTPQKKDITDFGRAKDENGNEVLRVKKYKQ